MNLFKWLRREEKPVPVFVLNECGVISLYGKNGKLVWDDTGFQWQLNSCNTHCNRAFSIVLPEIIGFIDHVPSMIKEMEALSKQITIDWQATPYQVQRLSGRLSSLIHHLFYERVSE